MTATSRRTAAFDGRLPGVGRLRTQLVFDAGAALLVLLVNTALAIYKPRGMTPYGWRRHRERRWSGDPPSPMAVEA